MKHKFLQFKQLTGLWLLFIAAMAISCMPEVAEESLEISQFPTQLKFTPLYEPGAEGDFSARKSCDYEGCGEVFETCLLAGQHIPVGKVEVYNDEEYVYIVAHTSGDWYFYKSHLKISATKEGIGQGAGNPAPGQFPYQTTYNPAVQKATYKFAIAEVGQSFYFAFHAEVAKLDGSGRVLQAETAWSCGEKFNEKGNWATFSGKFTVSECVRDPEPELCWEEETAWSDGDCYTSKGNWARFTKYKGVTTVAPLMAGKLYHIGDVTFEPVSGGVKITIALFNNGAFQNVAENVKIQGYTEKPSGNPAVGRFDTHKGTASGKTYSVVVPEFNFYGVHVDAARAVACSNDL